MFRDPAFGSPLFSDDSFQVRGSDASFSHEDMLSPTEDAVKYFGRMSENTGIGHWIESELRRREWRQADLARRAGISTTAISNWISGQRVPDPQMCDVLADVFRVDLDFVLELAGHRPRGIGADPNSSVARITAMVARVKWNQDREAAVEGILAGYLERDRKTNG